MAMTDSFSTLLAQVRANARLRLGLWIIFGLGWFYIVLLLRDEVRLAKMEQTSVAKSVARLVAQSNQTEWTSRAEQAQTRQIELENRLWREGTIGLAQATFQDWLNQAVQQSSLPRATVTVAVQDDGKTEKNSTSKSAPGSNIELWKVSAKVSFDFTPKGLYTILERIDSYDKQVSVETLVVRGPPNPRAEMMLVAYFQKTAPLEKAGATLPGVSGKPMSAPAIQK